MAHADVKRYFEAAGLGDRVRVLTESSATVEMAAAAIGCETGQIAKTLSYLIDDQPLLIVAAGHVRVDNQKYKAVFGKRPKFIPGEQVENYIGHEPGGVGPFAIKPDVPVYLDISLKKNAIIYPGAGSENSVVKLTLEELIHHSNFKDWVDIGQEV